MSYMRVHSELGKSRGSGMGGWGLGNRVGESCVCERRARARERERERERAYTVFDGCGEAAVRVIQPVAATENAQASERISFGPRAWDIGTEMGTGSAVQLYSGVNTAV